MKIIGMEKMKENGGGGWARGVLRFFSHFLVSFNNNQTALADHPLTERIQRVSIPAIKFRGEHPHIGTNHRWNRSHNNI